MTPPLSRVVAKSAATNKSLSLKASCAMSLCPRQAPPNLRPKRPPQWIKPRPHPAASLAGSKDYWVWTRPLKKRPRPLTLPRIATPESATPVAVTVTQSAASATGVTATANETAVAAVAAIAIATHAALTVRKKIAMHAALTVRKKIAMHAANAATVTRKMTVVSAASAAHATLRTAVAVAQGAARLFATRTRQTAR